MYSGKKAQHDFPKMRGEDQRPFGTFPKNHHFWRWHPSLTIKDENSRGIFLRRWFYSEWYCWSVFSFLRPRPADFVSPLLFLSKNNASLIWGRRTKILFIKFYEILRNNLANKQKSFTFVSGNPSFCWCCSLPFSKLGTSKSPNFEFMMKLVVMIMMKK